MAARATRGGDGRDDHADLRGALGMLAAVAAFVGMLVERRKRLELCRLCPPAGLVIPVCLVGYLIWRHVFAAAFDDVILFTARRYAPIQVLPFGITRTTQNYPLMMLFPIAGVLLFLICARDLASVSGRSVLL